MKLERPIVFFDVETTGLSLSEDRIIEISMIKVNVDGSRDNFYHKINPEGKIISPEAQSKHGMSLESLEEFPKFTDIAKDIYNFMDKCDLGGYNCKRFDIPLLIEEFFRADILLNIKDFNIIDVYKILTKAEPRTLEGVYKRFMGKDLEGAHGAEADVIATIDILEKMEDLYKLPETVQEINDFTFKDDGSIDLENKLKRLEDGKIIFNFGKYKDKTIQEVFVQDPSYYDWIIYKTDMTRYTKSIFKNIIDILGKK